MGGMTMQALISPNEKVYGSEGNVLGDRVAQVAADTFPVAAPLFWVPCADEVVADQFYWASEGLTPVPPPPPPPVTEIIVEG
jgi:hypothetical protein